MAPKKENTKKAAGNAKKAEVAAQKQAQASAQVAAKEDQEWNKGAKSNAKKEAAAERAAEAAKKKAEKDAILAEEEKNARAVPKGANKKTAEKKSKGTLDLGQLDASSDDNKRAPTLNASGIENALDALDLTSKDNSMKIDRHPERRFKAAYKAYEERRLPEVKLEHPGLRENQRKEIIRKEFEKSEENPFNQAGIIGYDADKDAIKERKEEVRKGVEGRLAEKDKS